MIDLVFASSVLQDLRRTLLHDHLESAAILLANPIASSTEDWRLLVTDVFVAGPNDYEERSDFSVRLDPAFGLPIERRAKERRLSIIYCHTHPHQQAVPQYSLIDDISELALGQYARSRVKEVPHGSILFSQKHVIGRELGLDRRLTIWELGAHLRCLSDSSDDFVPEQAYDRQIKAFGIEGQKRLQNLRVAIVGLGGTGSVVVQQLAYLGVNDYILIDPDTLEESNLNRVLGASLQYLGTPKVLIAERLIREQRPRASIQTAQIDVLDSSFLNTLKKAHFIFCCTDSQASRHFLNQFAHQYWIPVIDVGVAIDVPSTGQAQIAGRAAMLSPGLPCLWCLEQLNPAAVRREMMHESHVEADPYFSSAVDISQPAVISINSTLSSLAVTMFLSAVTGIPAESRFLYYDGNWGRVRSIGGSPDPNCNFCSRESTAGGGDRYPMPNRQHG